MADNTLLTINSQDIAGALFLAAYVIVAVLIFAADYGIRHGWFIPTDEACEQYRQRVLRQQNNS